MEEHGGKVVPASSSVEESCGVVVSESVVTSVREEGIVTKPVCRGRDAGLGQVGGSLKEADEEAKVVSAGEELSLGVEAESEVRRTLNGEDVVEISKEVVRAKANDVGDVVGRGSKGSSVVEGSESESVVDAGSSEAGVVKDGAEDTRVREVEPQGQSVESGGHLAVLRSSEGETAASGTEKGESTSSTTSIIVERSDADAIVVEGRDLGNATEKCGDTKGEALGGDVTKQKPSGDASKVVSSSCETNKLLAENDGNSGRISKSADKYASGAVEGNTKSLDDKDMTCPNIEVMDTDAYNEKFCFSVEELQATIETAHGSTEDQHNALAGQHRPYQPNQVVVQHEVPLSVKVLQNSEVNQGTLTEQLLHENVAHKATDDDQARIREDHEAAPQQLKVEDTNGTVKGTSDSSLDFATSHQSAGALWGDESATVDSKVSDNVKTAGIGLKKYTRTSRKSQRLVLTSVNDETAAGQLEADQSFGKNADRGPVQVESEKAKEMEFEEQGTCPMEVVSEDNHAVQNSGVCRSSDMTEAIDRGCTTVGNGEASTPGLQESAEGDEEMKVEHFNNSAAGNIPETGSGIEQKPIVDNQTGYAEYDDSQRSLEMEIEEQDSESEQQDNLEEKSGRRTAVNFGTFVKGNQARFQLQPDDEDEFQVSDLVWGKVRSHPWWPGQIFDASDASEIAIKYHKKDCFLVAYFGDRTFAWNEASLLRPFRSHFSHVEKQSSSEAFQNAVSCALDEVSRRVVLGLSCPCIPKEDQERVKFQIVENTGVRPESSTRECVDESLGVDLLEPGKLVEYVRTLAQSPAAGADRLDLVIAKSQLLAFYRLKGYSELPEFLCFENEDGLQYEDEVSGQASVASFDDGKTSSGQENSSAQRSSYHKRKHNLKDVVYVKKKEKNMSDSFSESWDSFDEEIDLVSPSGKKRKGSESFADDYPEGRKTIALAKVSPIPKPSFKIGECIRRVASQMTASPSMSKSTSQKLDGSIDRVSDGADGSLQHPEDSEMKAVTTAPEYPSLHDLLAQLFSAAEHPFGSYSVSNVNISFFSDFRNSVVINPHDKDGRSRELAFMGGSPETFEFEDMSDTYWTDRVIQNGSEDQPPRRGRKRQNQLVPADGDKRYRRSNSKKQHLAGNGDVLAEKPLAYVDENAPAELVMHFPIVDSVPSETNLNRMFRRFGPLKESDTEVDRHTNRARVVFKKCRDAEAAYGSAPKFNIFGQTLVNYQLNYSVSVPFKTPTIVTSHGEEDTALFLEY